MFDIPILWFAVGGLALLGLALSGLRVAQEYQRAVVFRLGRFHSIRGPGLYYNIPLIEWQKQVDMRTVTVDVEKQEVKFGDRVIKATVPNGPRNQLVGGTWDSTAVLLEAGAAIEATAGKLPYVKGF